MGKDNEQTVGYHYRVAYHVVLTYTIDAFIEFRGAERTAWDGSAVSWNDHGKAIYKRGSNRPIYHNHEPATGPITSSQRIQVAAPELFGGEKDQGGILGPMDIMFGEAEQVPNPYLQSVFGDQVAAWRGFTTVVFAGGRFGAMNPMPQKPSYKVRKILNGWDEGCWYPETAAIPFDSGAENPPTWEIDGYQAHYIGTRVNVTDPIGGYNEFTQQMAEKYFLAYDPINLDSERLFFWRPNESGLIYSKREEESDFDHVMIQRLVAQGLQPNRTALVRFWGETGLHMVVFTEGSVSDPPPAPQGYGWVEARSSPFTDSTYGPVRLWYSSSFLRRTTAAMYGMNGAHCVYYVRTGAEKGREARVNVNEISLAAAADRLYAEGFGLCWEYDPARDTPDSFEERICRIIGGSFERSITDGQWYLDLARGDYDIEALPIIGDDDILEFKESPTTLDRAVNSIAVKYFDVERKEAVITPAVRALGLIRRFGEIHETLDFPEIPASSLARRVAERELRARVSPTRTFDIVTNPRMKGLRRNQYFRLQSPKRGIGDMVCIVGSKEAGTLASGALRWKVSQDVYALPDSSYIEIEEGVDTRPPTAPVPIEHARVFEVPYIDLVALLPRTELEQIPDDAGYLFSVAASPGVGLDYVMCVEPSGGDYGVAGTGEWCPTTTTAGGHLAEIGPTVVPMTSVRGIENIGIGTVVLWDDEWCRLDALDIDAKEATLGRGCADTVPHDHAGGSRLWFFVEAAADTTEYTDGEQVNVKLLPSTSSQQLPLDSATAMPLEFAGRQARPYPPAGLLVNGEESPSTVLGEITLTWVHRDRVLQADQAIDQAAGGIGPEVGTTYNVRWYLDAALVHSETGITGTTTSYTPAAAGLLRIELESERDGLPSWQMHVREFSIGGALQAEDGSLITTETDEPILME